VLLFEEEEVFDLVVNEDSCYTTTCCFCSGSDTWVLVTHHIKGMDFGAGKRVLVLV
jgi:hypothetical protein